MAQDILAWDPYDLFETALEEFPKARKEFAYVSPSELPHQMAQAGFALCAGQESWAEEHQKFIDFRIETDLNDKTLEWFEEAAVPIRVFSCFVLGALLAKYAEGEIGDKEFTLADAHLAGFNLQNNQAIQDVFEAADTST